MGGPPHTQQARPCLTLSTRRGATVAAKCASEKKALDKAIGRANQEENEMERWQQWIAENEAALQSTLADAISDCIDSEQRLDEQCVIDRWIHAHQLLEELERFHGYVAQYAESLLEAYTEEERLRKAYCDCLNDDD